MVDNADIFSLCIYTAEDDRSRQSAVICVESGRAHGVEVDLYIAVYFKTMDHVHEQYGLKLKYKPVSGNGTDYKDMTAPRTKIANGTTHYLLYKWAVKHDRPIHILEHDALFVGRPPQPIYDGVIQTSSHKTFGMTPELLWGCGRALKMRKREPDRGYDWSWDKTKGVIPHPLSGTNGTSGYIIGPGAAAKMVAYIETDGIANADRIRTEHIGEGNLYLQNPQSVFCTHSVKSHHLT